ncbi:hypothetical protein PCASD_23378, partial [Puccinia coronata f. sp. avenae]
MLLTLVTVDVMKNCRHRGTRGHRSGQAALRRPPTCSPSSAEQQPEKGKESTMLKRLASTAHPKPTLKDLEQLRPTRLSKYLPAINPRWYIDQIQTTTKRLNKAFSKQQLLSITEELQQQPLAPKQHTKHSLISFILFNHWKLTNPVEIPTDQSFQSLLQNFQAHHQSHQLSHHELFLLKLEQSAHPKRNLLDTLTSKYNVSIHLDLPLKQITISGHMKDRQTFWSEFERTRRLIHTQQISTASQLTSDQLNHLAELSNCSLEQLNTNTLLAHSFDAHNLNGRVSEVLKRYEQLSTEYDNTPILIDLQSPSKKDVNFSFLPFSQPFELEWPHHLNLNQRSLSRFTSPVSHNQDIEKHGSRHFNLSDLHSLLSSTLPVLTRLASDSIDLRRWISDVFSSDPIQDGESLECKVYQGHYVKSKDPNTPLVQQILAPHNDDGDSSESIIEELRSFWTSHFTDQVNPLPHPTPKFTFLKSPQHPLTLNSQESHNEINQMIEEEDIVTEVYAPFEQAQQDMQEQEPFSISYEVIHTKRSMRTSPFAPPLPLENEPGNHAHDQDDSSTKVEKVWRKRVVVLRPNQSTDLMIQVEKRQRLAELPRLFPESGTTIDAGADEANSRPTGGHEKTAGGCDSRAAGAQTDTQGLILLRRIHSLRRASSGASPDEGRSAGANDQVDTDAHLPALSLHQPASSFVESAVDQLPFKSEPSSLPYHHYHY